MADAPAPTPSAPPADPPTPPEPVDDGLGEAGRRALTEERNARKHAEKLARETQAELERLRSAGMSEQEKAIAEARADARKSALAEANQRILRSEIRSAAAGKLADPGDAAALLGDIDQFLDKDGEVDTKAITSAIDALVKAKPYLASAGSGPKPLPGGGAKPSNGFSINDDIRARARGGV